MATFLKAHLDDAAINRVTLRIGLPRGAAARVFRGPRRGGPFEEVGLATATMYVDTADLTPGARYYYLVVRSPSPWVLPGPRELGSGRPLRVVVPGAPHRKRFRATRRRQEFSIHIGGHLDERNTVTRQPAVYCSGPGYSNPPYDQVFEPNLFVALENRGTTDVLNPWVVANGQRDWWSVPAIVADIRRRAGGRSATPSEMALAAWQFGVDEMYDQRAGLGVVDGVGDPVKLLNVYGFDGCIPRAIMNRRLAEAMGLKAREVWIGGLALVDGHGRGRCCDHDVAEVWADAQWHFLDTDLMLFFLKRDNRTVASVDDFCADADLLRRSHRNLGLCGKDLPNKSYYNRAFRERELIYPQVKCVPRPAIGGTAGRPGGEYPPPHTMALCLRPGEKLVRYWGNVGKTVLRSPRLHPEVRFSNGKLVYRPDLRRALSIKGVHSLVHVRRGVPGQAPALHPERLHQVSEVTWRVASPYAIAGARVALSCRRGSREDGLEVMVSTDARAWRTVWVMPGAQHGAGYEPARWADACVILDRYLNPALGGQGPDHQHAQPEAPTYTYYIKVVMWAGSRAHAVGIDHICFDTDIQCATRSLPSLYCGPNRIAYRDDTRGSRRVEMTYGWQENHRWRPCAAPHLIFPGANARVDRLDFEFRWQRPPGAGARVVDYHIQVSRYPDFRWCVCPAFDRYVSRTKYRGQTRWQPQFPNLLNPGEPYYWRVRGKTGRGVWGPWSPGHRFMPGGPKLPIGLRLIRYGARRLLVWSPNPDGNPPVEYRVHRSTDAGGFTVSKKNLVGVVREPRWPLGRAGKPWSYRVVAVDANAVPSTPSDFIDT